MKNTARLYFCCRCHAQVVICSECDRGQRYCSASCASDARKDSLHRAGEKYQNTQAGRTNNAARQARFRRKQQKVTHHGSPPVTAHDVLTQPSPRPENGRQAAHLDTDMVCHHCGQACGPFLRDDFLHRCRLKRTFRRVSRTGVG